MKHAGRVRITVEFLDVPDSEPATVEMDDCIVTQEAGINQVHRMDGEPSITHNGQQRLTLKAWKGCATYDSFQPHTEYPEL